MTPAEQATNIPTFGIQVKYDSDEEAPSYGKVAWIDLEDIATSPQNVVDELVGRNADLYTETWNMQGIVLVSQTQGLGKRISAYVSDVDGPWIESIEDLMCALQLVIAFNGLTAQQNKARFLRWLESKYGNWWLPGYGTHPPEDAVYQFDMDIVLDLESTDA